LGEPSRKRREGPAIHKKLIKNPRVPRLPSVATKGSATHAPNGAERGRGAWVLRGEKK
jgi:hypothetical protein